MYKKYFLSLMLVGLTACASSLLDNRLDYGEYRIKGLFVTKPAHRTGQEHLLFKRIIWLSGANSFYDAMLSPLSPSSGFWQWLEENKQQKIKKDCQNFLIGVLHTSMPLLIGHSDFISEMRKNSYQDFVIPEFARSLRTHPDFASLHMEDGKIIGFCAPSQQKSTIADIIIKLASFPLAKFSLQ